MGLAYCPIDQYDWAPPRPPLYRQPPVMDDTECNYVVMLFVAGVFLMGIIDSFRK